MNLIDTHAHLYVAEFDSDRADLISRAESAGVSRIYLPAIASETHDAMLTLEKNYPNLCFAMMGVHPCSIKENYKDELAIARDWLSKKPFKGVGEIGLDFYWDKTFTEQQYAAFHEQVEWALHYDLPVAIHSRNATDECIAVVQEHQKGKLKGVFHCFSGDETQARQIIELGFYLGIGGVITFKNSGLDKVMEAIPLDQVVLETDAPNLAPMPYRGKRNEPAYLTYIAEKLASVKNINLDEVAAITTANALTLFGT